MKIIERFGTIRNNTALKRKVAEIFHDTSFGTIRNNTALKQGKGESLRGERFWNHSKQHSSKTS